MKDLRSTAAFFRCSLNEAVTMATDMDVMRFVFEWRSDPLCSDRIGWALGEYKEGGWW